MPYLMYLGRSLLRRPKRHLSLLVILTCAFILPLLISVYRDSSAYGARRQLLEMTSGETFQIMNAAEEDAALFENIGGLSEPRYDNGVIYLHILSDAEWKDPMAVSTYAEKLDGLIKLSCSPRLRLVSYDYDLAHGVIDGFSGSEQSALLALNLFIILLSALIVGSAYKSHIRRFSSDIGILRSLGAEDRQIFAIFIAEFAVVFAMSAAAAVAISAWVMKILFAAYLEVDAGEGIAWIIFRIDPLNIAFHIAVFFAVLLAVITVTLVRSFRESAVSEMRADIQSAEMKKKLPKLKFRSTPEKSLASLWLSRTNGTYKSCLFVAIPIITVFLFLFGYLSLDADFISEAPEFELWITKDSPNFGGFMQEDIDYIESLPQVESVKCLRDAPLEIFRESAGGLMIDQIRIKLSSPELHKEVDELLTERFFGAEYNIRDLQAVAEQGAEMSKGIYLMLAFIFSAMFLFAAIIIYMKLRDYIFDSGKTVKTLSTLGATEKTVTSSYLRQSAVSAAAAAAVPAVLSLILLVLAAIPAAVKPSPDLRLCAVYIGVSALTVAAFTLPVGRAVKEILRKRGGI